MSKAVQLLFHDITSKKLHIVFVFLSSFRFCSCDIVFLFAKTDTRRILSKVLSLSHRGGGQRENTK